MKQLNLGCGADIRKGWVNLDIAALPGVDVVHNLDNLPLPFADNEFDHIRAQDILEHLEYIPVLKEIHRILKPSGTLHIRVPHFTSRYNFNDPTHKKMFSSKTFDFFVEGASHGREYYFDFHFSNSLATRIQFEKGIYFYNYAVEPIVNLSKQTRTIFEATFMSRLFPAGMMEITLQK